MIVYFSIQNIWKSLSSFNRYVKFIHQSCDYIYLFTVMQSMQCILPIVISLCNTLNSSHAMLFINIVIAIHFQWNSMAQTIISWSQYVPNFSFCITKQIYSDLISQILVSQSSWSFMVKSKSYDSLKLFIIWSFIFLKFWGIKIHLFLEDAIHFRRYCLG